MDFQHGVEAVAQRNDLARGIGVQFTQEGRGGGGMFGEHQITNTQTWQRVVE
jgi:hypothetical protein